MSFKPSSQTAENVHEEDDKAGKQCQRELVNFSVVSISTRGEVGKVKTQDPQFVKAVFVVE